MEKQVTIRKKRYDELMEAEALLSALEQSGVYSWSGYVDDMDAYNEIIRKSKEAKNAKT